MSRAERARCAFSVNEETFTLAVDRMCFHLARIMGNIIEEPKPSSREEPVRRYTSQACATFCIQVPVSDTN